MGRKESEMTLWNVGAHFKESKPSIMTTEECIHTEELWENGLEKYLKY